MLVLELLMIITGPAGPCSVAQVAMPAVQSSWGMSKAVRQYGPSSGHTHRKAARIGRQEREEGIGGGLVCRVPQTIHNPGGEGRDGRKGRVAEPLWVEQPLIMLWGLSAAGLP